MAASRDQSGPAGREPDFVAMIERHREKQGRWRSVAIVMLVLGLLVAAWGLSEPAGWRSSTFWLGLIIAALAVFPLRESLDRGERAEGIDVLRDEWRDLAQTKAGTEAEFDQLAELIRKTHG